MRIPETGQQHVKSVAAKWKRQYENGDGTWSTTVNGSSKVIFDKLSSLPDNATPADVEAIIGNDGWTGHRCCECGDQAQSVVIAIGQSEEHECMLCLDCAKSLSSFVAGVKAALSPEGAQ